MPITINDCKYCRSLPMWSYDNMGAGYVELILYCSCTERRDSPFFHEAKDLELADTIAEWNEKNPTNKSHA